MKSGAFVSPKSLSGALSGGANPFRKMGGTASKGVELNISYDKPVTGSGITYENGTLKIDGQLSGRMPNSVSWTTRSTTEEIEYLKSRSEANTELQVEILFRTKTDKLFIPIELWEHLTLAMDGDAQEAVGHNPLINALVRSQNRHVLDDKEELTFMLRYMQHISSVIEKVETHGLTNDDVVATAQLLGLPDIVQYAQYIAADSALKDSLGRLIQFFKKETVLPSPYISFTCV